MLYYLHRGYSMREKIENKKFWKKRKSYITIFIISLVIIIASGVLLVYFINKRNYNLNYQKNYFDLDIVNTRTGANIFLDLYEKPLLVNYYTNRNNDLFYIEINNKFYFIQSDQELIDEIKLSEYQNGRRIVGNVYKIDDKTKAEVINFVEDKLGITIKESEVENYISFNVFEYNPYYYMFEYFIAVFIAFVFAILCGFNYRYIYRFNKNFKNLTEKDIDEINNVLNGEESIYVSNDFNNYIDGIYICNKFIIDTKTLDIYNYSDIIQICFKEKYMKGIVAYKMLINFHYTDKLIKTTIVSDNFKHKMEKYIKDKKLNIITYEEESNFLWFRR